jgi:hypothetical protein
MAHSQDFRVLTLKRLDADWQKAQPAGPKTPASTQLPANVEVTLVQAGAHGARALAGVADVLANQTPVTPSVN